MSKFIGYIGYAQDVEVKPDVWQERIIEKPVRGEFIRRTDRPTNAGNINTDVILSNEISIIDNGYSKDHLGRMVYVKWRGTAWRITSLTYSFPRINIAFGGIYNGDAHRTGQGT